MQRIIVGRKKTTRKKIANKQERPVIEPTRLYSRAEAARTCGVGELTLFRAYNSRHLKAYTVGRRIQHSGQHLLDWLESGGRTGRTAEEVERERARARNKKGANVVESLATTSTVRA